MELLQQLGAIAGIGGLAIGILLQIIKRILERLPQPPTEHVLEIYRYIIIASTIVAVIGILVYGGIELFGKRGIPNDPIDYTLRQFVEKTDRELVNYGRVDREVSGAEYQTFQLNIRDFYPDKNSEYVFFTDETHPNGNFTGTAPDHPNIQLNRVSLSEDRTRATVRIYNAKGSKDFFYSIYAWGIKITSEVISEEIYFKAAGHDGETIDELSADQTYRVTLADNCKRLQLLLQYSDGSSETIVKENMTGDTWARINYDQETRDLLLSFRRNRFY